MTFKEECIKSFEEVKKKNEDYRKKQHEDKLRRERENIKKEFSYRFKIPFQEEYLKEKESESGNIVFSLLIEDVKIFIHFDGYNPAFLLAVPCHKCGKETAFGDRYGQRLNSLYDIGRILSTLEHSHPNHRICHDCKEDEYDKDHQKRKEYHEKKIKDRNQDVIKRFADVIADILREGGYRDLYNSEDDYE